MNIWDSVHRGLEKASQEAARIAKLKRLRSTIDGLTREKDVQSTGLINKTMDMFIAGQLTQNDLFPFCKELLNIQQQLNQAQEELKQIQASQPTPGSEPGTGPTYAPPPPGTDPQGYTPPPSGTGEQGTIYAPPPPDYQAHATNEGGTETAPPPPGMENLTVSSMQGQDIASAPPPPPPAPTTGPMVCPTCQVVLHPNDAFCHNCGVRVRQAAQSLAPTTYSSMPSIANDDNYQETVRADASFSPASGYTESGQQAASPYPQAQVARPSQPENSTPNDSQSQNIPSGTTPSALVTDGEFQQHDNKTEGV